MTIHKIESESVATSTIAADRSPTRHRVLTRRLLILAIVGAGVAWLCGPIGRLLVVLPLLLFGPGLLLERALLPFTRLPTFARPTLWLGLSLSAIALIYEWATLLGFALTPLILALLASACGLAVIWQIWMYDARLTTDDLPEHQPNRTSHIAHRKWWLALLAILALTSWTRISEIRELALPNWVDSVHHALMIRVAAERGQAPISLRPYLPIDQLPYHWGYHVLVAAAMQLSSMDLPQAMLVTGQVLNVLHALAAAGLAAYLWRRPLAGVVAALTVGLLSIFPAYYVSWGRYTQLTGLLLLPPLMIVWLELLKVNHRRPVTVQTWSAGFRNDQQLGWAIVLALLLAGLSLIHFIVLVFALCFMGVSGIAWTLGARRKLVWSQLAWVTGSAVGALVLAGPWLWLLATRALLRSGTGQSPVLLGQGSFYTLDPQLLWAGHNRILITLALAAALWGIRRRDRSTAVLLAWVATLCVLANPWLALYVLPALGATLLVWCVAHRRVLPTLGAGALLLLNPLLVGKLPYLAIISIETVVISLFLPVGMLLSGATVWLWERIETSRQADGRGSRVACLLVSRPGRIALIAGWSLLAVWGARDLRNIVNPATVLATPADVAAINWADQHTPPDARFLINAAPWLGTGRGADGGWWLMPLAGRWTSTPPALYDYGPADYVSETRARTQQLLNFAPGQESALYQLIDHDQITYIYLGPNPKPITAAAFPASQGFEQVYTAGGVTIFAVHRQ
ncbi:MAG: hypothetical protein ABIV47_02915 [Roseiflexaceae bacterium]